MCEVDNYTEEDWKHAEKELKSIGAELLPPDPFFAAKVRNFKCGQYVIPKMAVPVWREVQNFEAKEDDIYVVTYYKAGTTWMQKMVYIICNDPDGTNTEKVLIDEVFPFIEFGHKELNTVNQMKSPRFIKSHLPYELLPQSIKDKKCKIIYVARNIKDCIVSSYFFLKTLSFFQFTGSLEDHMRITINNEAMFSPYWKHNLDFWNLRHDANILFIKYEDMKKDLRSGVKQVALFLGKSLTDKQVDSITERTNFKSMSKDPSVNRTNWKEMGNALSDFKFMRKGESGDWKNYFTPDMNEVVDNWIKKNSEGTDLVFDYEI